VIRYTFPVRLFHSLHLARLVPLAFGAFGTGWRFDTPPPDHSCIGDVYMYGVDLELRWVKAVFFEVRQQSLPKFD